MIYEAHLVHADRSRSNLSDVDWQHIDRDLARSQPTLLAKLRDAAIIESYHPVHIPQILELVWDDVDATAILSIELFEGLRHFYGLKKYLDILGYEPRITEVEIATRRERALKQRPTRPDAVTALVNFMGSEHFAGYFFARLAQETRETVLSDLLQRFAQDEFRHANGVTDVLKKRLAMGRDEQTDVLAAAARFSHYGEDVVDTVPTSADRDLQAVLAFSLRIEDVCGRSLVSQLAHEIEKARAT